MDEVSVFAIPAEPPRERNRIIVAALALLCLAGFSVWFFEMIAAPDAAEAAHAVPFVVRPGEGVGEIAEHLEAAGLVRDATAFQMLAVLSGSARRLKAGAYVFGTELGTRRILDELVNGAVHEVTVTIPLGATEYDIDDIMAQSGVLPAGAFVAHQKLSSARLAGRFFPDTYRFFTNTDPKDIAAKMTGNFAAKTEPLLPEDDTEAERVVMPPYRGRCPHKARPRRHATPGGCDRLLCQRGGRPSGRPLPAFDPP